MKIENGLLVTLTNGVMSHQSVKKMLDQGSLAISSNHESYDPKSRYLAINFGDHPVEEIHIFDRESLGSGMTIVPYGTIVERALRRDFRLCTELTIYRVIPALLSRGNGVTTAILNARPRKHDVECIRIKVENDRVKLHYMYATRRGMCLSDDRLIFVKEAFHQICPHGD